MARFRQWLLPVAFFFSLQSTICLASPGGPAPTKAPAYRYLSREHLGSSFRKRAQVVFQTCPEQLDRAPFACVDPRCGGDSKVSGVCDKILLNGPQYGCLAPGCGTYCRCDSVFKPLPGQIIFQVCPEALGKPAKKCSECGGDSRMPGVCNSVLINGPQTGCIEPGGCGYYCQCSADDSSNPVVTTTVNGTTAMATFTPCSFSQFSGLRASTTITTSVAAVHTEAPTVVYAGGVGWCIAVLAAPLGLIPIGPPVLPEGAKEDDATCHPEPQCEDANCGGKNAVGLCSAGSEQGCPCQEEKQQCLEEPPKCTQTECGGDNGNGQCLADGQLKDCRCCPDKTDCSSDTCKGEEEKCTTETLKGCSCERNPDDLIVDEDELLYAVSEQGMNRVGQEILDTLFGGDWNKVIGEAPRNHPADAPTCRANNAASIPAQILISGSTISPKDLQNRMRETLCNNPCEVPKDIPESAVASTRTGDSCEIAVILPNNVEAWAYRGTQSTGAQLQDCWDSFLNITEKCDLSQPSTGWVNGPDPNEFFQSGYRPLNDPGAKHSALDPANALKTPSTSPPSTPSTVIGIVPTSTNLVCLDDPQGGWLADCASLAAKFKSDEQICTNDPNYCPDSAKGQSYCKASGSKCDPNGSDTIAISSFCKVAEFQSCALIIADKLATFGFPGSSCVKGSDLIGLIGTEQTTNGCGGIPSQGKIALVGSNDGASALCMAGSKNPGLCAA